MHRTILVLVLVLFSALTLYSLMHVGLVGLYVNNLNHPAGQQIFADVFIALSLVMLWMWRDAKATGRRAWPWIAFTLFAGSFGPLLYLLTRKNRQDLW
jgi:Terpene cyclase DEP1